MSKWHAEELLAKAGYVNSKANLSDGLSLLNILDWEGRLVVSLTASNQRQRIKVTVTLIMITTMTLTGDHGYMLP